MSEIKIVVDTRENSLFAALSAHKAAESALEMRTLEIGDILIEIDGVLKLIFERKSIADLLASMKDGRYNEQSVRLTASPVRNHNIYYIIEGTPSMKDKRTVNSAIFSLAYYKGFSTYKTASVDDTAYVIANIAAKLAREPARVPYDDAAPTDYLASIQLKKSSNITPENFSEVILSQIPGVSNAIAKVILLKFGNYNNLVCALSDDSTALRGLMMNGRKISKTTLENVARFVCFRG